MAWHVVIPTARGSIGLVATARGLSHVVLTGGGPDAAGALLRRRFPDSEPKANLLPRLQSGLGDYFAGRRVRFRVKLDLSGLTPFQRRVLEACAKIAYGKMATYGELARRIGRPGAARAVGRALARNPVPIVVPCHRVIAADGSLGGFSARPGVMLKRWLLELERSLFLEGAGAGRRT